MLNRHHSLSFRMAALVLAQNGVVAALLLSMVGDVTPLNLLAIASILIVLTLVTLSLVRRMLSPLKAIARMVSEIASDKPAKAPQYALRTDEIGTICRDLERLSRNHLDRILEDDTQREEQQQKLLGESARHLEIAMAEADRLKFVVEALDAGVRRLALGDLTARLDRPFPDEFEGLRSDFNNALTVIEETLGRISTGARTVFSSSADLEGGLAEAALVQAGHAAVIAGMASNIDALAETLRTRRMHTGHTANIAHNAGLDMRRSKEVTHAAADAMATIRNASMKIGPATQAIQEIAFEANMLALNAGIEASQAGENGSRFKAIAEEIRDLAGRAAEAAKEASSLSRDTAEAAELGEKSLDQVGREWDAMTVYVNALRSHVDEIAASSVREIEAVAGLRTVTMAVAKASRDYTIRIDALTSQASGIGREIGAIDHQAARFTPVTILTPGGVTVPESIKRPRPGSHLRLVKS